MPLAEGQVQIRDLVLGCDTPYQVIEFNPWTRNTRADQGGPRAWNHGAWSGAEWLTETVVPIRVHLQTPNRSTTTWLQLHQDLVAAFEPVGELAADIELTFAVAGQEFVMFGRPRMAEIDTGALRVHRGKSITSCAFVALDPRIYSSTEHVVSTGLPEFDGGLTVPFTVPFPIGATLVGGIAQMTNAGKATTPTLIRIDGPVQQPRVVFQRPDGVVDELRVLFDLAAGQWLDIDTGAHTALLNGVTSRRAQVTGTFPVLPPGTSTLRFFAAEHDDAAQVTVTWRDAW